MAAGRDWQRQLEEELAANGFETAEEENAWLRAQWLQLQEKVENGHRKIAELQSG